MITPRPPTSNMVPFYNRVNIYDYGGGGGLLFGSGFVHRKKSEERTVIRTTESRAKLADPLLLMGYY